MSLKNKEERNNYQREWAKNNPDKMRSYLDNWRKKNPEKVKQQRKRSVIGITKRRKRDRLIVLKHYSNEIPFCECCNEKELLFLTIDHINGGGNKQKKETNNELVRWLIKNKFPEGFQILCMNCNLGKHLNGGICPHKSNANSNFN